MGDSTGGLIPEPYTEDDYCAGVPCYWYTDAQEFVCVTPIEMSGRSTFDGSRKLTARTSNGFVLTREIGGCQLRPKLYRFRAPVADDPTPGPS